MKYEWFSSSPAKQWKKQGQPVWVDAAPSLQGLQPLQAWKGFGGCFNELGWKALSYLTAKERETILRELFSPESGCGFNYCRLPIGANDFAENWYSHNEHADDFAMKHFSIERDEKNILPYLRAARKHQPDLFLFASPWCPPTWLKSPPVYNYGSLVWKPEYLKAYALYFSRFVEEYAQKGFRIDAIHVQNEPNSNQKFPSCLWTGAQMRDFIRDYMGPLFKKRGLDCQIWAGTIERADCNAWAHTILSDAKARAFVAGVGYQWAGREAIQRTHIAWPDVPLVQTEMECGDGLNTWGHAHHVFNLIHHYLSNGAEACAYWNMVLQAGGESSWGWKQNSLVTVDLEQRTYQYTPEFYVMKHVAAFVKPGASVIKTEGTWAGNTLAFKNPDGRRVYVLHHPFDAPGVVRIGGSKGSAEFALEPQSIHTIVIT